MSKISAVYKITNKVTNDFYIGSSKDVKHRLATHKCKSVWKNYPNNQMYLDMQKYGTGKFDFEVLEVVEPEQLKEVEQQFIETLKPTYNSNRANGWDVDKYKEYMKEYKKEYMKEYMKEYQKSDKYKEYQKEYQNQLCCYNDEKLTLRALAIRFRKAGVEHPTAEAKKYLVL